MQIFGALVIFFFLEIFLYGFYIVSKKEKSIKKDVESIEEIKAYLEKEEETISADGWQVSLGDVGNLSLGDVGNL